MEEKFVSYSIALLLKELGFSDECLALFVKDYDYKLSMFGQRFDNKIETSKDFEDDIDKDDVLATLWQDAIDWLSINYSILIQQQFNGYTIVRKFGDKIFISDVWINAREKSFLKAIEIIKKN